MTGNFFSPGKLLLTSEYVVLDGALALALPTKLGQDFFSEEINDTKFTVFWEAYHQEKLWLKTEINYKNWEIISANLKEPAEFILNVLKNVQHISVTKFNTENSYRIKTNLQFPENFGLGSSSTLMNNLAEWAETDAFYLNEICLGGSGYDIAVAKEKSPILYQSLPEREITKTEFNPKFKNELIFIHLNQKQDSREGISLYRSKEKSALLIEEFSALTKQITESKNLEEFSELMTVHEKKLSDFLEIETIKEKHFKNCPVFVKSLGAWGGDFILSCKFSGFENYFSEKGFCSIFNWEDLII